MTNQQKEALLVVGGVASVIGVWMLYRYTRGSTGTTTQRAKSNAVPSLTYGGGFGQIAPFNPQPIVTLQPGESVYDPNSEALLNTPTSRTAGQAVLGVGKGYGLTEGLTYVAPPPKNTKPKPNVHKGKKAHKPAKRKPNTKAHH